jgi:hypothetical protein
MKTGYTNLAIFLLFKKKFTLTSGDWKTSRINSFSKKLIFNLAFWRNFNSRKKKEKKRLNSRVCGLGHRRRQGLKERVQNLTSLRTEFTRPK